MRNAAAPAWATSAGPSGSSRPTAALKDMPSFIASEVSRNLGPRLHLRAAFSDYARRGMHESCVRVVLRGGSYESLYESCIVRRFV